MNKPRTSHLLVTKRILRYVKGTLDYGILFSVGQKDKIVEVYGYTDVDWSGDTKSRSTQVMSSCVMEHQSHGVPKGNL